MNRPQMWIASLVVLVLYVIWNWVVAAADVHGFGSVPWGNWGWWLGGIAFAIFFTFIYTKGLTDGGLGEGIRYGLLIGLLWYLPRFFMIWTAGSFAGYGGGFGNALWHALGGIVGFMIYGLGASFFIKPDHSSGA